MMVLVVGYLLYQVDLCLMLEVVVVESRLLHLLVVLYWVEVVELMIYWALEVEVMLVIDLVVVAREELFLY